VPGEFDPTEKNRKQLTLRTPKMSTTFESSMVNTGASATAENPLYIQFSKI
jgi:hypothetical protein